MAMVTILQYPDPRLKSVGETVTDFGAETQKIIDDMFETLYGTENCAALAMTQLDFEKPYRITVIDFSPNKNQPLCLVNPEVIEFSDEKQDDPEACMSVPGGVYENTGRAMRIKVRAQDRHGKEFETEAEGFMAKCMQHEIDHLGGTLFIDRLSKLKRQRVDHKIKKHYRWKKQK